MKQVKILDNKTMRKRQRRLFFERIKTKINQWLVKLQAKKVVEKIRKEYIRTGYTLIILKSKKDIYEALCYLEKQKLVEFEYKGRNKYRIGIREAKAVDDELNNA